MAALHKQQDARPSWSQWTVTRLIYSAATLCIILAMFRLVGAISLFQPLQELTTGYEEESLFSIWKWIHGLPVYADIHDIPFAASYFNWGFYWFYGFVISICIKLFGLGDEWIPTFARMITLIYAVGLAGLLSMLLEEMHLCRREWGNSIRLLLSVTVVFSPLFGFWIITSRPDIAASFFEMAGLFYFIRYDKRNKRSHLLFSGLMFYLAWAFKQTSITLITGCCLHLILTRRFIPFFTVAVPMFLLYGITMATLGKNYIFALLFSQANMLFGSQLFGVVLIKACAKLVFLPAGIIAAMMRLWSTKFKVNPIIMLCFGVSLIFNIVATTKSGADDNYFLIPGLLGMFCVLSVIVNLPEKPLWLQRSNLVLAGILGLQMLVVIGVLTGAFGVISVKAEGGQLMRLKDAMRRVEGPVLVMDRPGNLPWIIQHPPFFILAAAYEFDRRAGVDFKHHGIGGLIKERFFQYLVFKKGQVKNSIDGAPLSGYESYFEDGCYVYFRKRPDN